MSSFVIRPKTLDDFQEIAVIASKYKVDVIVESLDNTKDGIRYIISKFEWAPKNFKSCYIEMANHFNIIIPESNSIKLRDECYLPLKYPFSPTFFIIKLLIFAVLFYITN